jgi:hypothetical protein
MLINAEMNETLKNQRLCCVSCISFNPEKCRVLRTCNAKVGGSIPLAGTSKFKRLRQSFGAGVLLSGFRVATV